MFSAVKPNQAPSFDQHLATLYVQQEPNEALGVQDLRDAGAAVHPPNNAA